MAFVRGVVGVTARLTADTCYRRLTGRCSLELIGDFFIRPEVTLKENDLLFCPRLRTLLQNSDMPLPVVPCDCGHVQAEPYAQHACVAAKTGLTLTLLPKGAQTSPVCGKCAGQPDADHWDLKALVKK